MNAAHPILDELRLRGAFGTLSLDLLRRVTRAVIRAYGFPPPAGSTVWTSTDISDAANDWAYDYKLSERRLRTVLAKVATDDELRRYLAESMTNHFRSQGRKTEFGARLLAVRQHVAQDERIVVSLDPDIYSLVQHVGLPPYAGEHQPLVVAAAETVVELNPWDTEKRRQPIALHTTVVGIVVTVLACADAPVMEDVVVHVVLHRCGVAWQFTETTWLEDEHDQPGTDVDPDIVPIPRDDHRMVADSVWTALDQRQRLLLHALVDGMTMRDIEEKLGVPRQTAQRALDRLKERLADLFSGSNADNVVALQDLTARSRALVFGTTPPGPASPTLVKAPS